MVSKIKKNILPRNFSRTFSRIFQNSYLVVYYTVALFLIHNVSWLNGTYLFFLGDFSVFRVFFRLVKVALILLTINIKNSVSLTLNALNFLPSQKKSFFVWWDILLRQLSLHSFHKFLKAVSKTHLISLLINLK